MNKLTVLDNGTRVATEQIPEFRSCSVGAWLSTGSRDEPEELAGQAHFLEHLLFKGTATRSAYDIAREMDCVGGQLNAFTSKEQTCYHARVLGDHVPIVLDILSDMLQNSVFDPAEFEKERSVISEELKMFEDSPGDLAGQRFTRSHWPGHPLGRPIIGYQDSIDSLTVEDIKRYQKERYGSSNLMICAAGQVEHESFVELVRSHFENYPKGEFQARHDAPPPTGKNLVFEKDCEQAYISYGGLGTHVTEERRYSFLVLDAVLGGSMSSRLFQEIRERRGLCYSVGTYQQSYTETGLFALHAGTSVESVEETLNLMDSILRDLMKSGLTDEELQRSKELLGRNLLLGMESTSLRMHRLAHSHLNHGRLIPVEELLTAVNETCHADIMELASEYLNPDAFHFTVLGALDSVRGVSAQKVCAKDLKSRSLCEEVMS